MEEQNEVQETGGDTASGEGGDENLTGTVMLAISTFRRSEPAIELALEKASYTGRLALVYVADVNLGRYLIGTDLGPYSEVKEQYLDEVLQRHKREGQERLEEIAERARGRGIEVCTHVEVGRFAAVVLQEAEREKPTLVITTRSDRPGWVKRLFGSPVSRLTRKVGCRVIEV